MLRVAAMLVRMAAKRLGEVKGGRRVIGRQKINFRKLLHPLTNYKMRQRWLKLKGGVMGTGWAGDIMIGLEMMRTKYVSDFPAKLMKPPGKPCLVSVSIVGLRNIILGEQLKGEPVLEVVVPSVKPDPSKPEPKASAKALAAPEGKGKGKGGKGEGKGKEGKGKEGKGKGKGKGKKGLPEAAVEAVEVKEEKGKEKDKDKDKDKTPGMEGLQLAEGSDAIQEKSEWVQFQKKPDFRLHDKDTNKKWTASGRTGYEFLNVVHLVPQPESSSHSLNPARQAQIPPKFPNPQTQSPGPKRPQLPPSSGLEGCAPAEASSL